VQGAHALRHTTTEKEEARAAEGGPGGREGGRVRKGGAAAQAAAEAPPSTAQCTTALPAPTAANRCAPGAVPKQAGSLNNTITSRPSAHRSGAPA
jgi:hypothetical protein